MKPREYLLAAILSIAWLAPCAWANDSVGSDKTTADPGVQNSQNPMHQHPDGKTGDRQTQGAANTGATGKALGNHQMTGTVEDLDTETGIVDVKTEVGMLKVHFPPKSLQNIKKGDRINLRLSFNTVQQ